jgi:UDP-2,3-diacylglucosamine pyrophosphatase LpxH
MSTAKRLTKVFRSADVIPFDDSSKFILLSDCHRGVNGWADDLAHNQTLLFHALTFYFREGYTYIELGDGDELWENKRFADIRLAHSHLFWLMKKFHDEGRFHLIWGNHNNFWRKEKNVRRYLHSFRDDRTGETNPLFEGLKAHEGLILRHSESGNTIFLVHGHQGDFWSDRCWRLSRFMVRYVWKSLQIHGIKDPTSPAKNFTRRNKTEVRLRDWILLHEKQMTICGHTHRSWFPRDGDVPYFNTGSCVHPRCITGIEIKNGAIGLVKWWIKPDLHGVLRIEPDSIEHGGPKPLSALF